MSYFGGKGGNMSSCMSKGVLVSSVLRTYNGVFELNGVLVLVMGHLEGTTNGDTTFVVVPNSSMAERVSGRHRPFVLAGSGM
mmetsp:Transcript_29037/g.35363  ORF Transcript_29037/g.35363 Transcript_29037/m.35363 type:complete len:82 (-) Transcript_29037:63-308(-)